MTTREQRGLADYLRLEEERPFLLKAIDWKLGDEDRLLYAKLIEEKDPERAEWLRLEVALHSRATDDPAVLQRFRELGKEIGFDFANVLFRDTILNCGSADAKKEKPRVRFSFACPKRWETLAPTEDESVRFCQECKERVYRCDTAGKASRHAYAGHCIAVPKELAHVGAAEPELVLGRPDPVKGWSYRLFSDD